MRALVLTVLDLHQEPNQRAHYVIRMLAGMADETVVAMKVRASQRSLAALIRDALSFRVRQARQGTVTTLAIHPPLNYAHAVAAGLVQGELLRKPGWLRRSVASTLSMMGIARDLVLVPSFLLVLLLKTRGVFDVCLVDGPWTATVAWFLRGLGRIRRFVYDDIDYVAGGQMLRLRHAYVAWLEKAMIRRADLVMSVGWRLGAHRRRTTGRDVLVIPNGVDPARFAATSSARSHPPTLVYVGHVTHYTGLDLAVCALPRIRAAVPDVRLLIVGGGDQPYVEGLKRLTAAKHLDGCVELRGPVPYDAVPAILAESDLGLATLRPTSLRQFACPLKVMEYMAAGLPVIGAAESETAELLQRYPCGQVVAFEEASLANAVIELLKDTNAYTSARETALKTANEFTWARAMAAQRAAVTAVLN